MGAVNFSLDPCLVRSLQSSVPLSVLVETGTFKGDTVAELCSLFKKIYSIELSATLWEDAVRRFENCLEVQILQGSSPARLRELKGELESLAVLYWLDAHWCIASATAGETSQCPLLDELLAIGQLNAQSVILIDDARLFLAPPLAPHEISQWPSFDLLVSTLRALGPTHELMVVNDVIAFYPKDSRACMQSFAQNFGMDWLAATNCMKANGSFMTQLEQKEEVIQNLSRALSNITAVTQAKDFELGRREEIIRLHKENQQQKATIYAYKKAYGGWIPNRIFARLVRRVAEILAPRLGNLNQYPPRSLMVPDRPEILLDKHPSISIVTPSYGQGGFIERTLRSVLDQQYPNLEYFIQDGGSGDQTIEILEKYQSQLSGWTSQKDSGQSAAINLAFTKTSGAIMAWLNSDDLLLPGTLKLVADYFNRHPEVDVLYGNRVLIDENDMEIGRWIIPGHDNQTLSWADYVPQETMFWRRSIWDKVGSRVDESFKFAMDWDLLIRFRQAGAKFAHISAFLGAFRIHELQKTSTQINLVGRDEMDRIRLKVLGRVPDSKEIRNAVMPYLMKHVIFDLMFRFSQKFK
jgi:glycosyltransferase involved in cell wall biosynthesis